MLKKLICENEEFQTFWAKHATGLLKHYQTFHI